MPIQPQDPLIEGHGSSWSCPRQESASAKDGEQEKGGKEGEEGINPLFGVRLKFHIVGSPCGVRGRGGSVVRRTQRRLFNGSMPAKVSFDACVMQLLRHALIFSHNDFVGLLGLTEQQTVCVEATAEANNEKRFGLFRRRSSPAKFAPTTFCYSHLWSYILYCMKTKL
jgi:hypothetical protein